MISNITRREGQRAIRRRRREDSPSKRDDVLEDNCDWKHFYYEHNTHPHPTFLSFIFSTVPVFFCSRFCSLLYFDFNNVENFQLFWQLISRVLNGDEKITRYVGINKRKESTLKYIFVLVMSKSYACPLLHTLSIHDCFYHVHTYDSSKFCHWGASLECCDFPFFAEFFFLAETQFRLPILFDSWVIDIFRITRDETVSVSINCGDWRRSVWQMSMHGRSLTSYRLLRAWRADNCWITESSCHCFSCHDFDMSSKVLRIILRQVVSEISDGDITTWEVLVTDVIRPVLAVNSGFGSETLIVMCSSDQDGKMAETQNP